MSRNKLLLGLALLAFALVFLRTAWVGDDVYITLRTVDNFVNGYGLRWNVAERVQSFTHPLWMFAFVPVYAVTRDAYLTALLVSFIASLWTFWLVTRRDGFAWLGAIILLLSKAFVDYSASGLENPATHLLLVLFFIWFVEKSSSPLRLSFVAALLALNRLDAILFVLPALIYLLVLPSLRDGVLPSKQSPRREKTASLGLDTAKYTPARSSLAVTASHMVLGFLPLILWEAFSLFYYGFFFPNTYYAKLGAGIPQTELLAQGFVYFLDSLQRPLTLTVIFSGIVLAFWRGKTPERLLALGSLLYLAYVLSIGGDFMSGRFLTASLLISVLLLMRFARDWTPQLKMASVGAVVLLGMFATPPNYIPDLNQPRFTERDLQTGINDERAYYYPISGLMNYRPGKDIPFSEEGWVEHGQALRASGKSVVDEKNVGFIGYFAGPTVHIVDLYALADPLLARLPASVPEKWRIGHFARTVPDGYLASLRTGENQIRDPNLAAYYDQLALIVRGPLFSHARLLAIWEINTGQYDGLLLQYLHSETQ
jgi:arabinofuranosyltransferase